jgi:cytochrome c oxidase subunit 4
MAHGEKEHHIVTYKTYFFVLMGLLFLTMLTVGVTYIELGPWTVFTALLIASLKAVLVLWFFMHLKFDHKIFLVMVAAVLAVFVILIVITFFDYFFR